MLAVYLDSSLGMLPATSALLALSLGNLYGKLSAVCRRALNEMVVEGVRTTQNFQKLIINHKDFAEGKYDTGFVDRMSQNSNKEEKHEK